MEQVFLQKYIFIFLFWSNKKNPQGILKSAF